MNIKDNCQMGEERYGTQDRVTSANRDRKERRVT